MYTLGSQQLPRAQHGHSGPTKAILGSPRPHWPHQSHPGTVNPRSLMSSWALHGHSGLFTSTMVSLWPHWAYSSHIEMIWTTLGSPWLPLTLHGYIRLSTATFVFIMELLVHHGHIEQTTAIQCSPWLPWSYEGGLRLSKATLVSPLQPLTQNCCLGSPRPLCVLQDIFELTQQTVGSPRPL